MDQQRLEEIEVRCCNASGRSWRLETTNLGVCYMVMADTGERIAVVLCEEDAVFIANAPVDISDLLSEVIRLKKLVEEENYNV